MFKRLLIITIILSLYLLINAPYGVTESYQLAPDVGDYKTNKDYQYIYEVNRDEGYYVNGTGQIEEYHRIPPPNPDKIPQYSHPTRTVRPFDKYYDTNVKGIRNTNKTPVIPNYNAYYSERRAEPYTKNEFIDVWCDGIKYEDGVDCQSDDYAITFIKARDWAWGVIKVRLKARKVKKKPALFVMVDELGLDGQYMHDIKEWAKLSNLKVYYATIDSQILEEWIP